MMEISHFSKRFFPSFVRFTSHAKDIGSCELNSTEAHRVCAGATYLQPVHVSDFLQAAMQ